MNKFNILIWSILFCCGCNDDVDFKWDPNAMTTVKMVGADFKVSEQGRSSLSPSDNGTLFSWQEGDIVAVYSESKGMTNFYIDNESISANGTSANFNGSGFKLLGNNTYYAFYPYSSSAQSLDKTNITVNYNGQSIESNGDFSSLGKYDYMYSKGTTNENGNVEFSFEHLGCAVEYNLTVPKTAHYTSIQVGVEEEALYFEGTVNLTTEKPTIKLNEHTQDSIISVKLNPQNGGINVEKDSLLKVYMMMPPQNLIGKKLKIRLIDNNQNWYVATIDGQNMRAGYTYHYEISKENGDFTGSGTGLPDDQYSMKLVSTYNMNNPDISYEGMILDGSTLYASGTFGVQAINYSNTTTPKQISNLPINSITNGRNDMYARSIAQNSNYLYVPLRQSSSGVNENKTPEKRFKFESITGKYPDFTESDGISSNTTINQFFKRLHIGSINIKQNFTKIFIYKALFQNGYYLNTINLQGEDGSSCILFRETFPTLEQALSALKSDYKNSLGDYCSVDWSVLEKSVIFRDVKFYFLGEFDFYTRQGTASISGSTIACPNTGLYSICLESGDGTTQNSALLISNVDNEFQEGCLSFWCRVEQTGGDIVEIPLAAYSGENILSFIVQPSGTNNYTFGLKIKDNTNIGGTQLKLGEWYNIKIQISPSTATLYWRTKETGKWSNHISTRVTSTIKINQLTTGLKNSPRNVKVYFDDYYYSKSDIDDVAYINGKLAIIDKRTFKVNNIYNLDLKAIDSKIYGNRLIVTCFYGFNVYDITDPANPQLTYTYRFSSFTESQNCEIYENAGRIYVIICNYTKGYLIADITDLNNVSIVCKNDYSNILYNGENMYGKIYNFDVVVNYPYAYFTNATTRGYLNTSSDRRGILTINLSDFNNPNPQFSFVPTDLITTITGGDPRPTHIAHSNNHLIINNADKGILVFDIATNGIPVYKTHVTVPGKPCINEIYVPNDGQIFISDNNHGGSQCPDRNIYLYEELN